MSKYPKLREVYEEILSEDWFKNYRKNPPASSVSELGKIKLDMSIDTSNYCHTSDQVVSVVLSILSNPPGCPIDEVCGIKDDQLQKIFDYFPLEKILELIDYRAHYIARNTGIIPDPDHVDYESEQERLEDEEQERLEDENDSYDPYSGDVPRDPVDDANDVFGGRGGDSDYSGYVEEAHAKESAKFSSNHVAYEKILSEDWFKNYRKNPPASSLQELGDFSNYDEFKMEINSLIVNLFNENNFQPTPYQKLFDYLSLTSVFNLIYTFSQKLKFTNESSISTLDESSISTLDEYSTTPKLNDNKTISSLSQIRTRFIDVKADGYFCIECIVLKIPERREIHTKSGESIPLSQIFVEDDTGQLWVRGWRNQAKLIDKCELGDIISITGLNAKENNLEKGRLELFLTSNSTIKFKS